MKKIFGLAMILLSCHAGNSQQAAAVDSMRKALSVAKTPEEKADALDLLSRGLMNVNPKEADECGNQLIALGEESRDRKMMIKAYVSNATRCGYFAGMQDYAERAIGYYNKALSIAKQNKWDQQAGEAYIGITGVYLRMHDKEKAMDNANQAFSMISLLKNDSLKVDVNNLYGNVYLDRNEKMLALRYFLNGLRLAEDLKNASLERSCYLNLSSFYAGIEDYDKAIDYASLAYKKFDEIRDKNVPYRRAIDINNIGQLYSAKKNYDIAITYFQRSLAMADSLKFSSLKAPAYLSLLNQYLERKQPRAALDYFNSAQGEELKSYLKTLGLAAAIDQGYAVIYTELNKLDSAKYYFSRCSGFFENGSNEISKMSFYAQLATLYGKTQEYDKAIDLYLKVKGIADRTGQLESAEAAAKHLDTLYIKSGNFQQAAVYNSIYYKYKDSLETINKQKELAQVEAADEQYRQDKLKAEEAAKQQRRNNIQYMSITIGIVVLFMMLVVLGMFKVSTNTIKLIGFFAFLMFFEFIYLVFSKNIHALTHEEPLRELAFMIALAALLVPLHHWIEGRVIKFLTSHNRLTASGKTLLSKVFTARKNEKSKT